jgi:hypothetical protein
MEDYACKQELEKYKYGRAVVKSYQVQSPPLVGSVATEKLLTCCRLNVCGPGL